MLKVNQQATVTFNRPEIGEIIALAPMVSLINQIAKSDDEGETITMLSDDTTKNRVELNHKQIVKIANILDSIGFVDMNGDRFSDK